MNKATFRIGLNTMLTTALAVSTVFGATGCQQPGAEAVQDTSPQSAEQLRMAAAEKAKAAAKPETPAEPATPAAPKLTAIEHRVSLATDFFVLNQLQEDYAASGRKDPKAEAAFKAKEEELRATNPPKAASEYFEILGTRWRMPQGAESPGEGKDAYMIAEFLVAKVKPLETKKGESVEMFMRLKADKSHQHYFEQKRRSGIDFQVPVDTSDEAWPAGERRFIQRPATVPVLPYNLFVCFNVMSEDGTQLVERLGGTGQGWADLGWLTGLPEASGETEESADAV
jgi:hypothetical protein